MGLLFSLSLLGCCNSERNAEVILEDSIKIMAEPEAVFRFFEEIECHYLAWHPDHVLFRWEHGRGVKLGNVFYFEERIAGKLLKKQVTFTRVVPNEHIEFAPTFWLMRLFLPCMLFRMAPEAGGCQFIAEIHLRMGPLAQRPPEGAGCCSRAHAR